MKNKFSLWYYDRFSGELKAERVFAAGFLYWSYNTRPGRALTRWVLAQPIVSRCVGWIAGRRWTRHLVGPFARSMQIPLPAAGGCAEAFSCFNDFFVREYDGMSRKDFGGPLTCVSPAEAKVLVLRDIDPREPFRVKRSIFSLERLLADRELSRCFDGGTVVICRLGLSDYHHFHFPVAGTPEAARAVPGKLYANGPYALTHHTSFYAENFRMVTMIDSDLYGPVAQVEIGAFTVGSIRQCYVPGRPVAKGETKGLFALGGSTIVLVFARGVVDVDLDLSRYSARGLETKVRVGDSIGCLAGTRRPESLTLHGWTP